MSNDQKTHGLTTEELFARNRDWAASMVSKDPEFFKALAHPARIRVLELRTDRARNLHLHREVASVVQRSIAGAAG